MRKLRPVTELNLGFNDAENYKRRENKQLLNQIFVKSYYLDDLCEDNVFFLMGEKGTGKTAYAVFLTNNTHRNISSLLTYIRETEYQKFVVLKKDKHLVLSDYASIWKVVIYLLMAEKISRDPKERSIFSIAKFRNLKEAIDDYYKQAFSPEIINAMNFVDKSSLAAKVIAQYAEIGAETGYQRTFSESRFQTNLMYIQNQFEEALSSIKLRYSHILFIDGIDVRPSSIPYDDYLDCVKGLANAVWSINNDFFANIKDSPGRLRVVLLIRPDIFNSLGLQNQNSKVRDNSVMLDWRTTYDQYKSSMLFRIADKLLGAQQPIELELGQAWGYYFPYRQAATAKHREYDPPFISFLRFSLYRPRDIVTMLSVLQENFKMGNRGEHEVFSKDDFDDASFRRKYSTYLLGEIKDHLCFYYSSADYEMFLKFFQFLKGATKFNYDEYLSAYGEMIEFIKTNEIERPRFLKSPDGFLQFLYELNVICYVEDPIDHSHPPFIRWCFRERTPSNISPKVKAGVRYEIHYGLVKALRMGKRLR